MWRAERRRRRRPRPQADRRPSGARRSLDPARLQADLPVPSREAGPRRCSLGPQVTHGGRGHATAPGFAPLCRSYPLARQRWALYSVTDRRRSDRKVRYRRRGRHPLAAQARLERSKLWFAGRLERGLPKRLRPSAAAKGSPSIRNWWGLNGLRVLRVEVTSHAPPRLLIHERSRRRPP